MTAIEAEVTRRQGTGVKIRSTALVTTRSSSAPSFSSQTGSLPNLPKDDKAYCDEHKAYGHATENCIIRFKRLALARIGNPVSSAAVATVVDVTDAEAFVSTVAAYSVVSTPRERDCFYLDSCASDHMVFDHSLLDGVVPHSGHVRVGDDRFTPITGRGSLRITSTAGIVKVSNVLLVPALGRNLISVSKLEADGFYSSFGGGKVRVSRSFAGPSVLSGHIHDNIYVLDTSAALIGAPSTLPLASVATSTESLMFWHRRLGHLNVRDVVKMAKDGLLPGFSVDTTDVNAFTCDACLAGKAHRLPSYRTGARAVDPLQIIHIDLWGKARTQTQNGSKYMLTCYDDHTRKIHVFFLRHKSDALDKLKIYIALVENQLSTTVKAIRSDNGGEFSSDRFQSFLESRGIEHLPVPPGSHAQNGRVERAHLTLLNGVRTVLAESGLPPSFWAEAASYIAYCRNRSPNSSISAIPEEIWRRHKLSLKHLQPFGATAWYRLPDGTNKLSPRAQKAVLVGFVEGTTFYRLWDPALRKFLTARDVTFTHEPRPLAPIGPPLEADEDEIGILGHSGGAAPPTGLPSPPVNNPDFPDAPDAKDESPDPDPKEESLDQREESLSEHEPSRSESPDPMLLEPAPRRSDRLRGLTPSASVTTASNQCPCLTVSRTVRCICPPAFLDVPPPLLPL